MDVRCFKLITGVEVIAEFLDESGAGYFIRRPLQVHFMRGPDGSEQMAFSHWIMTAVPDQKIEILDGVLACRPLAAVSEIAASYIENTSGIVLPQKTNGQIITG